MSIDYQLYWMSMTNRVIIPKVGTRHNLEDQNVFKFTAFATTPQKDHHKDQAILWKKSMSAFKKFKDKKDRKDKRGDLSHEQPSDQLQDAPKTAVKLIKKTGSSRSFKPVGSQQEVSSLFQESNLGYYDPNEAPLYKASTDESCKTAIIREKKIVLKQQTTVTCKAEQMIQSIESDEIEEENPVSMALQPLPGDPFIIIRKRSSKKSVKSSKTKFIKKQKIERICFKDWPEPDSNLKDKRLSLSHESPKIRESNSERNSSEENIQRASKKIFTLQQIVQSATLKINEDNRKTIRLKEPSPEPSPKFSSQKRING